MDSAHAGLNVREKMNLVKEQRAALNKRITNAIGSTLDSNPDTEDERTHDALARHQQIEEQYRKALKATTTWKLFRIFPASKTISVEELSSDLDRLLEWIIGLRNEMTATQNARENLGVLGALAFRNNFSDSRILSPLSSRMSVWSLSSELSTRDVVYQSLQLTESDFNAWWYRGSSPREDSLVLKDLKILCIRIVKINDKAAEVDEMKIPVHEALQKLVEGAKMATKTLVELLIQYPGEETILSSIFKHISLATFATSKVALGPEDAIQASIPLLQPIMDKVRELCDATKEQLKRESPNAMINVDVDMNRDQPLGNASTLFETFDSEAQVRSMFDSLRRILQKPKAQPTARLSNYPLRLSP